MSYSISALFLIVFPFMYLWLFSTFCLFLSGNSGNSPVVEGFGSFVMDMFSIGSDLDLSVNFGNIVGTFPRDMKIKTLRKFAKKFYSLQSNF